MNKVYLFACILFLFIMSNVSISCSDDAFDDGLPDVDSDTDSDSDSDSDTDTYDNSWSCLICS